MRHELLRLLRSLPRAAWIAGAALVAVAGATILVTSGGDGDGGKKAEPAPPAAARAGARSFLRELIPSSAGALPGAKVSGVIRRLVARMPPERKAAQLLLVGFEGRDPTAVYFRTLMRLDLGGVVLERRNYQDPIQLEAMTTSVVNATARRGHEPPLILARQSGGEQSAFPDLPPAAEPGELANLRDAAAEYGKAARRLRKAGLNGVIGPTLDVDAHEAGTLGTESFSDDPQAVAGFAKVAVAAFRANELLSAPEHFPGIGTASEDTDEGPAQVGLSLAELQQRDLLPFRAAIDAGAPAVLVSHASYAPDDFVVPASLSRAIVTNLLRGGLGFRGLAISDDLAAGAVTATQPATSDAAIGAIAAGIDMVWISGGTAQQLKTYRALVAAIRTGRLARARVDAAVTRILTVKRELGLRLRRRTPPPQYPNAANPGLGGPPAPTAAPQPAPAPAPQPQPKVPPAGQ